MYVVHIHNDTHLNLERLSGHKAASFRVSVKVRVGGTLKEINARL